MARSVRTFGNVMRRLVDASASYHFDYYEHVEEKRKGIVDIYNLVECIKKTFDEVFKMLFTFEEAKRPIGGEGIGLSEGKQLID